MRRYYVYVHKQPAFVKPVKARFIGVFALLFFAHCSSGGGCVKAETLNAQSKPSMIESVKNEGRQSPQEEAPLRLKAKTRELGVHFKEISNSIVAVGEESRAKYKQLETPGALTKLGAFLVDLSPKTALDLKKRGESFWPTIEQGGAALPFAGGLIVRAVSVEALENLLKEEALAGLKVEKSFSPDLIRITFEIKNAVRLFEIADWLSEREEVMVCEPDLLRKHYPR